MTERKTMQFSPLAGAKALDFIPNFIGYFTGNHPERGS